MKRFINEHGEHIVQITLDELKPITNEDRDMVKQARKEKPLYDKDCPPLTDDMLKQAEDIIAGRRARRPYYSNDEKITRMVNRLWETGRSKDAKRAETDREFRLLLLAEFEPQAVIK